MKLYCSPKSTWREQLLSMPNLPVVTRYQTTRPGSHCEDSEWPFCFTCCFACFAVFVVSSRSLYCCLDAAPLTFGLITCSRSVTSGRGMATRFASMDPPKEMVLRKERQRLKSKHLWDTIDLDWDALFKLYVHKPTGLSRDTLWRQLFWNKHRLNPWMEQEYQGIGMMFARPAKQHNGRFYSAASPQFTDLTTDLPIHPPYLAAFPITFLLFSSPSLFKSLFTDLPFLALYLHTLLFITLHFSAPLCTLSVSHNLVYLFPSLCAPSSHFFPFLLLVF